MNTIWKNAKIKMAEVLPQNSFSLWIRPLKVMGYDDSMLSLGCPNKFSANWIAENYLDIIKDNIHSIVGHPVEIKLTTYKAKQDHSTGPNTPDIKQLSLPDIDQYTNKRYTNPRLCLNKNFVFNRFVVGPSNEFAFSASNAFARSQSWDYQTLLMLADTGLGKTHLSQAVGHSILQQNPESKVFYITAEDFTNEMVLSLKTNKIEEFKNKYRRMCDVLLLEEIQFLSGKEKTQIELGYTLDTLMNDKKKIVFTSSLPPKDIPRISKVLSSRLTSGLITTIDSPDYQTRYDIITRKSAEQNLQLSEEIVSFLADCLTQDVRQIESVLHCLKAKSDLLNVKIDMNLVKDVISSFVSEKPTITLSFIQNLVAKYFKVDPEQLQSKSRKKIYVYPRNIYIYLSRCHTNHTLKKIGKSLNRSHSAVIYASDLVEHKMKTDAKLRKEIKFLSQKIEENRQ